MIVREHKADGTFAKRKLGYKKKTCTKCGRYLYLGQFYKYGKSKDHPDGYDCRCKECRRKEANDAYARNRKVPDGLRHNSRGQLIEKHGTSQRLHWGEEKLKDFKRLFPYNTNEDVAIDMGCSVRTVVRRAREMGLEKDPYWLQNVWNKNRKLAHGVNKVCGLKNDLTNFIEGGKRHRFTSENHISLRETPEERSERVKKAWVTRRRKSLHKK